MATTSQNQTLHVELVSKSATQLPPSEASLRKLDPRLKQVKLLADRGDFQAAMNAVPNNNSDPEFVSCRAVCLMRMGRFAQAIAPLRTVALNTSTFHVRSEIPLHIQINYALALFFGGEPGGGLDALNDIRCEADPQVTMIRSQSKSWVSSMNWLRRLDWYFNRIAPKPGPTPPSGPIGYFPWEVPELVRPASA